MKRMAKHSMEWKKSESASITELAKRYPVVAVANLSGFPASQFQELKKKLRGKAMLRVSKMRVIKRALGDAGMPQLADATSGSCALVFAHMNPFELFSFLKGNAGRAAAKPGSIAPQDIVVPAGDTGLPPGPALGELKAAGLDVRIQGATIVVAEPKVVAKANEPIPAPAAAVLSKLNIRPIEVRLRITAVLEDGQLYMADVLDINSDEIFSKICKAYANSYALALEAAYPTRETTKALVQRACSVAKEIALKARVYTPQTVGVFFARAEQQANALSSLVGNPAKPAEEKTGSNGG